jgi:hypothetical protein
MTSPSQGRRGGGQQRKRRRVALIRKQQGLCHWCGQYTRDDVAEDHPLRTTLSYLTPPSLGGARDATNQVASCRACNIKQRAADRQTKGRAGR